LKRILNTYSKKRGHGEQKRGRRQRKYEERQRRTASALSRSGRISYP
jgi:hypothetical protein